MHARETQELTRLSLAASAGGTLASGGFSPQGLCTYL